MGSLISFVKQLENCGFHHCRFGSNKKMRFFIFDATIRATTSSTIVAWETQTPTPEPLTGSGNIFSFRALICSGVAKICKGCNCFRVLQFFFEGRKWS